MDVCKRIGLDGFAARSRRVVTRRSASAWVPDLVAAAGPRATDAYIEFFTATAWSLNGLAELYRAQGQYTKAEPLHQRALAIREKALGPEHPEGATSLENYARLLRDIDRTVGKSSAP
jgi:hypothetical protein